MALDAGTVSITLEFAQGLKDQDWFGKQDPYAIVKCGGQTFRTKTHVDGGKNPVWNETFSFNILNENSINIEIKDEDSLGKDDTIGTAIATLVNARGQGEDRMQLPVSRKNGKQQGFLSVSVKYVSQAKPANAAAQQRNVVYVAVAGR